jgi:hypothetical protein
VDGCKPLMTGSSAREAVGTALVLVAAEGGFRLQRGVTRRMPVSVQRAAAPLTLGRGSHSSTSQLNLSRFGHTSPCPPV